MDNNFTDTLIKEYNSPATTYSQLYNCELEYVPEDVLQFMKEKADNYSKTGFGYKNKNYNDLYNTLQIDVNANSDEVTYLKLLSDPNFVEAVNQILTKNGFGYLLVIGPYDFNYNGITDHNKFEHITFEAGKTVIDILRKPGYFNKQAIWSIEVKTGLPGVNPTSIHKADLCFKHILGTTITEIWVSDKSVRSERSDDTYKKIGQLSGLGDWKNIRIDGETGKITKLLAV